MSICALCLKESILQESHIIPSFVYKWIKDSSGSEFLRSSENPNVRIQDGVKSQLLCLDCERILNRWETVFSRSLFHPYNKNPSLIFSYNDSFAKFCVSVSWRILYYLCNVKKIKIDARHLSHVNYAISHWRQFLLGTKRSCGVYEQHVLPMDFVESHSVDNIPNNINRYLVRGIDMDMVTSRSAIMTYTKMGRFIVFGYVKTPKEKWFGTKVSITKGEIKPKEYHLPVSVMNYIFSRVNNANSIYERISSTQKEKIDGNILRNIERFGKSEQFRALMEDHRLFGETAVIRKNKS